MSRLTAYMDRKLYPEYGSNWDNELFRRILLGLIKPDHACLDYGAGRGNVEQMNFKGIARFVAGIDPEEEVFSNPFLNEAKLLDLTTSVVPYDDNTFDIVFSNNVMEHIHDPEVVLREVRRVLKPGGVFVSKTPNKWHYMPIIARLTPTWFHKFYNGLRGRDSDDTFPTEYELNSRGAVARYAAESGFVPRRIQLIEGRPEYLRLTAITYLIGYIYERFVNTTDMLARFRCVLISELEKPSARDSESA